RVRRRPRRLGHLRHRDGPGPPAAGPGLRGPLTRRSKIAPPMVTGGHRVTRSVRGDASASASKVPRAATPLKISRGSWRLSFGPQDVLQLQTVVGNQAVQRLLASTSQYVQRYPEDVAKELSELKKLLAADFDAKDSERVYELYRGLYIEAEGSDNPKADAEGLEALLKPHIKKVIRAQIGKLGTTASDALGKYLDGGREKWAAVFKDVALVETTEIKDI